MITFEQLRVFYHIATYQNLSNAADFLKMDKSSASRQLRSLERFLNRPLFIRSSHGLTLTSYGSYLLEKARAILFELKTIEGNFLENHEEELNGVFRLTSTHALITTWLTHFLHEFVELHPRLRFEITGSNPPLDMRTGEIDAAIRCYIENAPFLVQVPLMRWRLKLYATAKYINRFGMPQKAEDLDNHRLIIFNDNLVQFPPSYSSFPLYIATKDGRPRQPFITINSVPGMYNLVSHHLGIGCFSGDSPHFSHFQFVPILPDLISTDLTVYYIYPENYQQLRKIRLFEEFLKLKSQETNASKTRNMIV